MERATGEGSLKQLVLAGEEDKANRIICEVVKKLHSPRIGDIPELVPLPVWFEALKPVADKYGGILVNCNEVARGLLTAHSDTVVLHGDIHYDNILDSGTRGWIAIDPKGLLGERGFDFANIFCNPNNEIAASAERLSNQVKLIVATAGLDHKRLLKWIIAWAGLSAAWMLNDWEAAGLPLTIAKIALNELNSI
jgi:streptomycin 6-kinase